MKNLQSKPSLQQEDEQSSEKNKSGLGEKVVGIKNFIAAGLIATFLAVSGCAAPNCYGYGPNSGLKGYKGYPEYLKYLKNKYPGYEPGGKLKKGGLPHHK